jgi:ABC-2 type transport system permease protein
MRSYVSYFKLQLINSLQYKIAALAGIVTQFFWGFILIFIYEAFYTSSSAEQLITFSQLVPYIWLHQAFFTITYLMEDKDINEAIRTGSVCYELTKPYNLYWFWYIRVIAKRYASVLLRFSPVFIVGFLLPAPYNLTPPISLAAFLLFLITLALASFLIASLLMLLNVFTFYNNTSDGLMDIAFIILRLLSGTDIPIPFLPNIIQRVTYLMPFRLIGDLPYRVYTGNIGISEGIFSVGLQLFWISILIIIGMRLLKNATKRIYIQGG